MTTLWEMLSRFASLFVWWTIVGPWELAIRVRLGKSMTTLGPGIHFRIPHLDAIYKQSVRMRITQLQMQTISTRDGRVVTLCASVGFCVSDISKLYNTLHHADETIRNMVSAEIATFVQSHEFQECAPGMIEKHVNDSLDLSMYGLDKCSVRIIDFAAVKVLRLLQDQRWSTATDLNTSAQSQSAGGPA